MVDNDKILLVFDLDHTILDKNSDIEISSLFQNIDNSIYSRDREDMYWGDVMQKVYLKMKNEGIQLNQIKSLIQSLELSRNFPELFKFIRSYNNRFENIIISGANTLFIKWLIEKHQWEELFSSYFSNPAEPHEEKLISINNYHNHTCPSCDGSQCKKIILKDFLSKQNNRYKNIVYLGDGSNDFCPSTILKENDILFPRKNFALFKELYKKNKINMLECKVFPWEDGLEIIEVIKENYLI